MWWTDHLADYQKNHPFSHLCRSEIKCVLATWLLKCIPKYPTTIKYSSEAIKCLAFIHVALFAYPRMWITIHLGCWWEAWRCESYRPWSVCLPCSRWTCTNVSPAMVCLLLLLLLLQLSSEKGELSKVYYIEQHVTLKQNMGWRLFQSQRLEEPKRSSVPVLKSGFHGNYKVTCSIALSGKNACPLRAICWQMFVRFPQQCTCVIPIPCGEGYWER